MFNVNNARNSAFIAIYLFCIVAVFFLNVFEIDIYFLITVISPYIQDPQEKRIYLVQLLILLFTLSFLLHLIIHYVNPFLDLQIAKFRAKREDNKPLDFKEVRKCQK
jgi:hypothetical protein